MARQPTKPIPFEPLYSGRKKKPPIEVIDDRRAFYGALSGLIQGREVLLIPSGAWPDVRANAPALQEVLRCTLPRPEPVTVYFHPWVGQTERFRESIKFYAHCSAPISPVTESLQGRIFIEWGVGSARNWTYCDLAPGSLSIPACSWISVSGWIHTATNVQLAASAQIGYLHPNANCNWTAMFVNNALGGYTVQGPNFARELTGFFYSTDVLAEGAVAYQQAFAQPAQYWLMRPAITPNPQTIPFPPVRVPISVGYVANVQILNPGPTAAIASVGTVLTVRI
jgi:hypothetical protein